MISYKIIKSKPSTEFHGGEDRLSHRFPWLKTSFSPPDQERPGLAELFAAKRAAAKAQEKPKTVERLGKNCEVMGIYLGFDRDLGKIWMWNRQVSSKILEREYHGISGYGEVRDSLEEQQVEEVMVQKLGIPGVPYTQCIPQLSATKELKFWVL